MTARRRHLHCQKHFHFNPSRDPRIETVVELIETTAAGSQSRNRVSPLPGRFATLGNVASYRALTPAGVCGNRNARRPTELLSLSGHDRGENEHVPPRDESTKS